MTISGEDSRDWEGKLGAWIGARWRWLIVAVLLLFAFNRLVGVVVGSLGSIARLGRYAAGASSHDQGLGDPGIGGGARLPGDRAHRGFVKRSVGLTTWALALRLASRPSAGA